MKLAVISVAVIFGLGTLLFLSANNSPKNDLTYEQVKADVIKGAKFYDVRTPAEFSSSHFTDTTNLPLATLQSGAMPDVAKDTKIYIHCQSGNRSAQATTLLKEAGYTNVIDLRGLNDVQSIGGQLTT